MIDGKYLKIFIAKYGNDAADINRLVVTEFIENHNVQVFNDLLESLVIKEGDPLRDDLELLSGLDSIEDVIHVFELAVPREDAIANGAVYTPKYIRDAIVKGCIDMNGKAIEDCCCADISCGCGAFIYTLAKKVKECTSLKYGDILDKIYGIDISGNSICRTKILLSLVAANEGESLDIERLHLYVANTLEFDFSSIYVNFHGFDIIVGNPPYVRAKHIDPHTKKLMERWTVSSSGNPDLYITFLQIGLEQLNENGIMGVISLNSFFKSVNARKLRNYFSSHKTGLSIVNFGEELIFGSKMAYSCLVFAKNCVSDIIEYVRTDSENVNEGRNLKWSKIRYTSLDDYKGWDLNSSEVMRNISIIKHTGSPLGKLFNIKNGIATLANDVFIFRPVDEDSMFYYFSSSDGNMEKVEKDICRDIIKPNVLKSESEIEQKLEKIIYPYDSSCRLISEDKFRGDFPYAYEYLSRHRDRLLQRDKGNPDYSWYAFGRTQALNSRGKRLMFPYMTDHPRFVYSDNEEMLIYCGYAIYDESEIRLKILKRILESSTFDYYMRNTSKPYAAGFYSYAKNYVKNFGVCELTDIECEKLLSLDTKKEIDAFVAHKYGLALEQSAVRLHSFGSAIPSVSSLTRVSMPKK